MAGENFDTRCSSGASFIFGTLFAYAAMVFLGNLDSKAAFGFLGVLTGSGVAAATNWLTAREQRKQQWALAALDKRLAVHQEAFVQWKKVIGAISGGENVLKIALDAERWLNNNCIYLDAVSGRAFQDCLVCAVTNEETLKTTQLAKIRKDKQDVWKKLMKPGQVILAGVSLPNLAAMYSLNEYTADEG